MFRLQPTCLVWSKLQSWTFNTIQDTSLPLSCLVLTVVFPYVAPCHDLHNHLSHLTCHVLLSVALEYRSHNSQLFLQILSKHLRRAASVPPTSTAKAQWEARPHPSHHHHHQRPVSITPTSPGSSLSWDAFACFNIEPPLNYSEHEDEGLEDVV
jgi:hypothetical protein